MNSPLDLTGYPPELYDRYPPLRLLGRGGMGEVYLATDPTLGRSVAIKISVKSIEKLEVRLKREAQALAGLRHPNVVEIFDLGSLGKYSFIVMEYLEGRPLGPGIKRPLEVMTPIASAIEFLHSNDLVHRDLKPQNIFLAKDGRPVLLDFGLVRTLDRTQLTATGTILGTLPYLSPEALKGAPMAPPSDWYAWGATLYELIEGLPPFNKEQLLTYASGGDFPELAFQSMGRHDAATRIVRACMALDPKDRPRSAADIEALRATPPPSSQASFPLSASGPSAAVSAPLPRLNTSSLPYSKTTPRPPGFLGGVLLGLVGMAGFAWWASAQFEPALAPAPPAITAPPQVANRLPARMEDLGRNRQERRQARNLRDGAIMILLPAVTINARARLTHSSQPVPPRAPQPVPIPALWVDKYEVTVQRYRRFLEATGAALPTAWDIQLEEPQRPAAYIGLEAALAYAKWAGGRLPTGPEWERISAGPEGRTYPWGEEPPTSQLANYGMAEMTVVSLGVRALSVVGSYPAGISPDGIYDLAGNIAEWGGAGPLEDRQDHGLLFGGSFLREEASMVTWFQRSWPLTFPGSGTGFRIVREHSGFGP